MRRTLTYVWSLLCLCFLSTAAMAQNGQYDVRFAVKNFDCATNKVTIQVQVKAHDAAHIFLMGDANYRFDYDPRVISNPVIISQENFSNQVPSSNFNYNAQTLQGSSAGLTLGTVSLNNIYGGGGNAAKLVTADWTTVSCIRFDVQDATKCMDLIWHDNNRFPITGMNEVVLLGGGNYDLYVVNAGGIFGNYSQCIPSVCNSILAQNDVNTTLKNSAVSGNLLTNDISASAMTATTTAITAPTRGILTIAANGAYNYIPTANFVGQDSAQYRVCNLEGLCDTAWLYLNVIDAPVGGVSSAPIAQNDNGTAPMNTPITGNVLGNDLDLERGVLTVNLTPLTSPTNGTLVLNTNGTFTYTPNDSFVGQDTFRYVVCDNGVPSLCNTASVFLTVTTPKSSIITNLLPTPTDDSYLTYINMTVTGNLKSNDSDPNAGQTLIYTTTPAVAPTHGTVTINADGTFSYVPTTGYTGPDYFVYTVCDNGAPVLCTNATANLVVTTAPNQKPVVTVTPQIISEDTSKTFCLPIVDPNTTDTHTVWACTPSITGGTATAVVDNIAHTLCVTYKSAPNYNGQDTVCFIVCNNGIPSKCDTAKIPITVTPVNDKPFVPDVTATTPNTMPVTVCAPITDVDVTNTHTMTLCGAPTMGSISAVLNNVTHQLCVTYTPTLGSVGKDSVCIIVCDSGSPSLCDTATVYFTIYDFSCVTMNLKVLLEGSLYQSATAGVMRTTLNERGLLPGQTPIGQFAIATPAGHPYKGLPWNVADTTGNSMTTYAPDVTDWVLVSLRTDNVMATNVVCVPALLLKDGTVQFVNPCFSIADGSYYIVVEHRNHMGAMSPTPVAVTNGVINFDFTTSNSLLTTNVNNPPAFGQRLVGAKWALHAGDGLKNTQTTNFDINFNDSVLWKSESGIFDQYRFGDFDMNADVNFQDQVLWKGNNGKYSVIPH